MTVAFTVVVQQQASLSWIKTTALTAVEVKTTVNQSLKKLSKALW